MDSASAPALPDVQEPAAATAPPAPTGAATAPHAATDPPAVPDAPGSPITLDTLGAILLDVTVELGRCEMPLGAVARLDVGSVVELDTRAGEPLAVFVNGRQVAVGEPVVMDGQLGLRITALQGG